MGPKLLLSVLCRSVERGGWLSPELAMFLVKVQRETKYNLVTVLNSDCAPVQRARNIEAQRALEFGVEWLCMLDNDIVPPLNMLDVLDSAGPEHDVICLPYWGCLDGIPAILTIAGPDNLRIQPGPRFVEISRGGTGAIFIRREVFVKMPMPHFEMRLSGDGLRIEIGEDYDFCNKVRALGCRVWTHGGFPVQHMHQLDLSFLGSQLRQNIDMVRLGAGVAA